MSTSFVDSDGTTRFRGEIVGGAVAPGSVGTRVMLFVQTLGAGIYTATAEVAPNTLVYGFFAKTFGAWDGLNAATLDIGDTDDAAAWATGAAIGTDGTGQTFGDLAGTHDSIILSDEGGFYPNGTTITAVITDGVGLLTTGRTTVGFMYTVMGDSSTAVKT